MVNNLSGRMENLESISGLKTECFHLVQTAFSRLLPNSLIET